MAKLVASAFTGEPNDYQKYMMDTFNELLSRRGRGICHCRHQRREQVMKSAISAGDPPAVGFTGAPGSIPSMTTTCAWI